MDIARRQGVLIGPGERYGEILLDLRGGPWVLVLARSSSSEHPGWYAGQVLEHEGRLVGVPETWGWLGDIDHDPEEIIAKLQRNWDLPLAPGRPATVSTARVPAEEARWRIESERQRDGQLRSVLEPELVLAVASLAAFLGAFTAGFAKELGGRVGAASAAAVAAGAHRLRDHVRAQTAHKPRRVVIRDDQRTILISRDQVESLPDEAWEQLASLDIPEQPGTMYWSRLSRRWQFVDQGDR